MADTCRVCGTTTEPFATATVLESVEASYERCPACGLVMATDPVWLDEAYSAPITKLDIGLLDRCLLLANITSAVLGAERLRGGRFLDWAGGYGTFTRLMRDRGYDFSHWDPMATNVFAEGHESPPDERRFDLVTGFEVLEHLVDPVADLAPIAASTDRLLMTTQVLPDPAPQPQDWWYYTLETGQHVTLFSRTALEKLAHRLGFEHVVTGSFVHLFHRGHVSAATRALVQRPRMAYGVGLLAALPDRRHSLLAGDLLDLTRPPGL